MVASIVVARRRRSFCDRENFRIFLLENSYRLTRATEMRRIRPIRMERALLFSCVFLGR